MNSNYIIFAASMVHTSVDPVWCDLPYKLKVKIGISIFIKQIFILNFVWFKTGMFMDCPCWK